MQWVSFGFGSLFPSLLSCSLLLLCCKNINSISPLRAVEACPAKTYWRAFDRSLPVAAVAVLVPTAILGHVAEAATGVSAERATSGLNTFVPEMGSPRLHETASSMVGGDQATGLRYHRRAEAHSTTSDRVVVHPRDSYDADWIPGYRSLLAADAGMQAGRLKETSWHQVDVFVGPPLLCYVVL